MARGNWVQSGWRPRCDPDLVDEIMGYLETAVALDNARRQTLERYLRETYGGRRSRVARVGESSAIRALDRNIEILEAWRAGADPSAIARKHGITRRRVLQICAGVPRPPASAIGKVVP